MLQHKTGRSSWSRSRSRSPSHQTGPSVRSERAVAEGEGVSEEHRLWVWLPPSHPEHGGSFHPALCSTPSGTHLLSTQRNYPLPSASAVHSDLRFTLFSPVHRPHLCLPAPFSLDSVLPTPGLSAWAPRCWLTAEPAHISINRYLPLHTLHRS